MSDEEEEEPRNHSVRFEEEEEEENYIVEDEDDDMNGDDEEMNGDGNVVVVEEDNEDHILEESDEDIFEKEMVKEGSSKRIRFMMEEEEEEKTEDDDDDEPQDKLYRRQSTSRSSVSSNSRRRRSSRLDSLLEVRRESMADISSFGYTEEELMKPISSTEPSDESHHPYMTADKQERLRRISQRVSVFHEQLGGSERLVEVRLHELSYHVPIRADTPTVPTVWNATPLYRAYRFFRRLYRYGRRDSSEMQDLSSFVPSSKADILQPYRKKTILHKMNLVLKPGNSYLILGPPGCGKTSLLKAIAGSLPGSKTGEALQHKPYFEGRVEYNGLASQDDWNMILPNICSYVQQHDYHAARLTIQETFEFALQCRTGSGNTKQSSEGQDGGSTSSFDNNITMESLGLSHVKDTFVGDEDIRGISGGQRRRVTVGEMMQSANPVACADEISTGLDASVAYDICLSIVTYAKAAKTTRVMSLLQPGPEVFVLFDEIILLSEGYLVYAGPIDQVVDYFEDLGYVLPATVDVADFLQSLPTPDGALYLEEPGRDHLTAVQFAQAFQESHAGQALQYELESSLDCQWKPKPSSTFLKLSKHGSDEMDDDGDEESQAQARIHVVTPEEFKVEFQNSFWRSTRLNFKRHYILWTRDIGYIIGRVGENVGMAVATGGILFGQAKVTWDQSQEIDAASSEKVLKLVASVFGALYMACFYIVQGAMVNAPEELDGRPVHYKHADANFYQSLSFAVGRLFATFPQRAIDIVMFGLPLYWMVGFYPNAGAFFIYLLLLFWLIVVEKQLFGITVATVKTKQMVLGIGSFVMLIQLLFSGFIVYPDAIPGYYDWLYWINPMAWTFQSLLLNEFLTPKYNDSEVILRTRGFPTDKAWVGWSFLYLSLLSVAATLVMAYALKKIRFEATKPKGIAGKEKAETSTTSLADSEYDSKSFTLPFTPVDVTFENVEYEVRASKGKETIKILNGISGSFRSGRLCALMGSSGAGKTTLMDVVAMRKESGTVTGDIRLNGFEQERTSFLRSSGYVEQFDVQSPELTVKETVAFSARLRLDSSNPDLKEDAEKLKFVDGILKLLELTPIEKVQVGSYDEGGLSFEQRKRLAIAVELAGSPSILFLDEPTSGLDARAAVLVMRLVKRIADTGRTVCSTIHQPSSAVFELFDDLMLLETGGRVVFFGELGENSARLIEYFESNGASPIEHGENPSSWMLRVLGNKESWNATYMSSPEYDIMVEQIQEINASPDEEMRLSFTEQYPTTWKERMKLMYRRISRIYLRSPAYNLTRVGISVLYAFLLGSLFIGQSAQGGVWTENQAEGVLGTMFLALTIMGTTCITMVVPVMKRIRDVFYKHRASGMIEESPLALSLSVGEAPYIGVIAALFGGIYYATVSIFRGPDRYVLFWIFFGLNLGTYSYLGQCFMCLVKDTQTAGALMGALIGYNVFFSGFVVKPQYFVGPFQIGYWTAPGRFAYEGLVVSQFSNVDVPLEAVNGSPYFFSLNCTFNQPEPCKGDIESYVNFSFGGRFNENNFWIDVGGLLGYIFVAWILTAFALKKFNYVNT